MSARFETGERVLVTSIFGTHEAWWLSDDEGWDRVRFAFDGSTASVRPSRVRAYDLDEVIEDALRNSLDNGYTNSDLTDAELAGVMIACGVFGESEPCVDSHGDPLHLFVEAVARVRGSKK